MLLQGNPAVMMGEPLCADCLDHSCNESANAKPVLGCSPLIWLPVHHNIFSHSLTCERFAECEEHVEYSGIVHNVDSSHPNWKRSGQELGETLELIDAKVPTKWILLLQCH